MGTIYCLFVDWGDRPDSVGTSWWPFFCLLKLQRTLVCFDRNSLINIYVVFAQVHAVLRQPTSFHMVRAIVASAVFLVFLKLFQPLAVAFLKNILDVCAGMNSVMVGVTGMGY